MHEKTAPGCASTARAGHPRLPRGHALRGARRDGAARAGGGRLGLLRHAVDLPRSCSPTSTAAPRRSRREGLRAGRPVPHLDADLAAGRDRLLRGQPPGRGARADPSALHRAGDRRTTSTPAGARMALTLDAFYGTLAAATPKQPLETIVLARIPDYLSPLKRLGFWLTKGRKIPPVPADPRVRWWPTLMARRAPADAPRARGTTDDPAAILFSGGTTGAAQGHRALEPQLHRRGPAGGGVVRAWARGDAILAILPIFHGFGLGVCVNAAFMAGGKSILVPQFSAEIVAKLLRTRPAQRAGGRADALRRARRRDPSLASADLSCLTRLLLRRRHAAARGEGALRGAGGASAAASVKLLEGYGLTEAVTGDHGHAARPSTARARSASRSPTCSRRSARPARPRRRRRARRARSASPGPAVMLGYLDDPEATAQALRAHADGRTWLHTGDLGRMDADGFFYFTVRLKRMIKSSGFNVYPAQVEAVLREHPAVAEACVIGVPDPAQVERVKACVVLRDPAQAGAGDRSRRSIAHCRERLIKWSCPREVEFRRRAAAHAGGQGRLSRARAPARGERPGERLTMDGSNIPAARRRARRGGAAPPTACASSSRCAAGTSRRSWWPPRRAASASSTRATRRPRSSPPTRWRG